MLIILIPFVLGMLPVKVLAPLTVCRCYIREQLNNAQLHERAADISKSRKVPHRCQCDDLNCRRTLPEAQQQRLDQLRTKTCGVVSIARELPYTLEPSTENHDRLINRETISGIALWHWVSFTCTPSSIIRSLMRALADCISWGSGSLSSPSCWFPRD